jgi:hypothetical protein
MTRFTSWDTLEPTEYEAHVLNSQLRHLFPVLWKLTPVSHCYSVETLLAEKIKYLIESCRWEICTSSPSIWIIFHIQILATYFPRCGDQRGLWSTQPLRPSSKLLWVVERIVQIRVQPRQRFKEDLVQYICLPFLSFKTLAIWKKKIYVSVFKATFVKVSMLLVAIYKHDKEQCWIFTGDQFFSINSRDEEGD